MARNGQTYETYTRMIRNIATQFMHSLLSSWKKVDKLQWNDHEWNHSECRITVAFKAIDCFKAYKTQEWPKGIRVIHSIKL